MTEGGFLISRRDEGEPEDVTVDQHQKDPRFVYEIPRDFREISGKFPGSFREWDMDLGRNPEISGNRFGNFREISGKFPGNSRES